MLIKYTVVQLVFEQIRTGGDRNFGYLLGDRHAQAAVLIDPSYAPGLLAERAAAQELTVTHVVNTHGHPDHTEGNAEAVRLTGAAVAAHPACPVEPDVRLDDGARLTIGALALECLHVPGHAADHLVLYEPAHRLLFTGDLVFVGKVGGTQTDEDAATEWTSLRRVLDTSRTKPPSGRAMTTACGRAPPWRSRSGPTRSCSARTSTRSSS